MIFVGQELHGLNLRELAKVRSRNFQAKVVVVLFVTASLVTMILLLPGFWWILPSLLLGLVYAHAVELQHQCLHNTAYRSKRWNRLVGVPLGLPLLVSFSDYQNSHLNHHRLLGTPEDKEFFNYGYRNLTSLRAFIPHVFMVNHYYDVLGYIARSSFGQLVRAGDATPKMARRIRFEYQLMAIFLLGMAAVTIIWPSTLVLKLWVIPFLVGVPGHALIELPEHMGCNTAVPDVLGNTRTIRANKLLVWFMNGNNYHVEHHWLPGVPNDKFPVLHTHVSKQIQYLETSYWSFYSQFFKHLRRKTVHGAWREPQLNVTVADAYEQTYGDKNK